MRRFVRTISKNEGAVIPSYRTVSLIVMFCLVGAVATLAGSSAETRERNPSTLVTLVLHQKKTQSLVAFKEQIKANGFQEAFPPDGVEIVSWTGSLGLGHVITLQLPTYKVPEVRAVIENRNWDDIEPKIYSSYDFEPFWKDLGGEMKNSNETDEYTINARRMLIAP